MNIILPILLKTLYISNVLLMYLNIFPSSLISSNFINLILFLMKPPKIESYKYYTSIVDQVYEYLSEKVAYLNKSFVILCPKIFVEALWKFK